MMENRSFDHMLGYRALSESVRNCIDPLEKMGAKNIGDDFIAEANRLSEEKLAVELEKTKIQMDINYREGVVADKQIIADALKAVWQRGEEPAGSGSKGAGSAHYPGSFC